MKRFENDTKLKSVDDAIFKVTSILQRDSAFRNYVETKNDWQYNSGNGKEVWIKLFYQNKPIIIELYTPKIKSTNAIANFNGEAIQLNSYVAPLALINSLCGSIIHEYSHAQGFHHQDKGIWGYVRRNYWTKNKSDFSVPYHLSDNIGKWL